MNHNDDFSRIASYFRMYPYKMRIEREQNEMLLMENEHFRMYPYKMRIERHRCG